MWMRLRMRKPPTKMRARNRKTPRAHGHVQACRPEQKAPAAPEQRDHLQAELSKSLDAKKAKPGDEVTAKLTQDVKADGKVVMHKGSRLVGHVTEAQAKSKENAESKLGIVFDKAVSERRRGSGFQRSDPGPGSAGAGLAERSRR